MTIEKAFFAVTDVALDGAGGLHVTTQAVDRCTDCGCLVMFGQPHPEPCMVGIKPERPEPLKHNPLDIAQVMVRHEPIELPLGAYGCSCNPHARFANFRGWVGHASHAIADGLDGIASTRGTS